jgi:hypothetical protein
MQKVEGSNPFSRLSGSPLPERASAFSGPAMGIVCLGLDGAAVRCCPLVGVGTGHYLASVRFLKKMPMRDPADRACRICGEVTRLSFEHVPPKGTGNTGRVEMLGIEAWLAREDHGAEVRGEISQRGSGAYSLCRDCNSRAGELYVPEFKKLHGTGIQALEQFDLAALDARDDAGYVEMKWQGVRPGRLGKQIATMSGDLPRGLCSGQSGLD